MTAPLDAKALEEAIRWMRDCDFGNASTIKAKDAVCDAAEAHLATLPRTKMVEVWHVEYCIAGVPHVRIFTEEWRARGYETPYKDHQCIRVTGPHQHEVPA